ncbi:aromatic alcohol reductase [Chitinophaga varians]|uniref:aromatic alcohol reductase n=1 Tax=Chitinophaga varians TaxID=2202339 RepID=UPI00165F326C|nr:aromatic alcohol reductase [Chitinophaga varians]MBC9914435.1 aromatic alcohol reductase [Chitinophaga varians]
MEKSFLVIGTGELGQAMLNSLLTYQQTHSFTMGVLIQRSRIGMDEVSQHENYKNVTIEAADLVKDSKADLASIFRKYDTVICCSGFSIGAGMQVKITEAVLEAGVRRYIPWQFGVDYDKIGKGSAQPVFDEQLDVRQLLRSQNKTHWIIISTGMITSFIFREDFGVISLQNKVIHALGDWQHSLTLTSCEDIGALTTAILFQTPELLDQVIFVAGDTVTFEEIADKMEKLYRTKFHRVRWSIPELKENLQQEPENIFNRYRLVFTHPGVTWPMSGTFNAQKGISTTGIEQWAKENLLK